MKKHIKWHRYRSNCKRNGDFRPDHLPIDTPTSFALHTRTRSQKKKKKRYINNHCGWTPVSQTMCIIFTVSVGRTDTMEPRTQIILCIFQIIILLFATMKHSCIFEHKLVSFVREKVFSAKIVRFVVNQYLRNAIGIHLMPFEQLEISIKFKCN